MMSWDEAKRAANIAKHGMDLAKAEGFDFASAIIVVDDRADYGEVREVACAGVHAARQRHPHH